MRWVAPTEKDEANYQIFYGTLLKELLKKVSEILVSLAYFTACANAAAAFWSARMRSRSPRSP